MAIDYRDLGRLLWGGGFFEYTLLEGPDAGEGMARVDGRMEGHRQDLEGYWREVAEMPLPQVPCVVGTARGRVFVERWMEEPELVICGGGHVSLELACLADYMGYPYTVIDDREEFASRERFPKARRCLCMAFEEALTEEAYSHNAYFVIVTRGHAHDLTCLELVLRKGFGYVGMIGSRAKVGKAMEALRGKGYGEQELGRVHAPIGLPIGGDTPKEVALSIMAQLVQTKNRESLASYLDAAMREALVGDRPMVLAKITAKRGSAPRGAGSRMLVGREGILAGTIGGGKIEYEAERQARELIGTGGSRLMTYRLDTAAAGSLGMWCGGEVDVFFRDIAQSGEGGGHGRTEPF